MLAFYSEIFLIFLWNNKSKSVKYSLPVRKSSHKSNLKLITWKQREIVNPKPTEHSAGLNFSKIQTPHQTNFNSITVMHSDIWISIFCVKRKPFTLSKIKCVPKFIKVRIIILPNFIYTEHLKTGSLQKTRKECNKLRNTLAKSEI